jgi:small subunit ribosomal protein S7
MPRRKVAEKREIIPDPRYKSQIVAKFITRMMVDGKKSISTRIMYQAFNQLEKKAKNEPLEVFLKAIENVKPLLEVKSRRVGGSTYQVPVEIHEKRREALAMRWLINAARARSGKTMSDKLSAEFFDAFNSTGVAFKKKEDTHRMAEANKAFAHYKW